MKYINGKYYGLFNEVNLVQNPEDLQIFNCVDTGVQYRFFEGKWYKQPFYWVDSDDIDGGGGGGGGFTMVEFTSEDDTFTIQTKAEDLYDAASTGCVYARISYPEEAGGGTAISPLAYAASLTDGGFLFKIYDVWDNQNDLVCFNAATGGDFPTGSINP